MTTKTKPRRHAAETALEAPPAGNAPTPVYQPSRSEAAAIKAVKARQQAGHELPAMKLQRDRGAAPALVFDHADQTVASALLALSLNSISGAFLSLVVHEIKGIAFEKTTGAPDPVVVNACIAMLASLKPQNEAEVLLGLQMFRVHRAMGTAASKLNAATMMPQWQASEQAMNRLGRTYVLQMEALKRLRSTGEQRVVVQRVNVAEGGQAIVGDVRCGGGGGGDR